METADQGDPDLIATAVHLPTRAGLIEHAIWRCRAISEKICIVDLPTACCRLRSVTRWYKASSLGLKRTVRTRGPLHPVLQNFPLATPGHVLGHQRSRFGVPQHSNPLRRSGGTSRQRSLDLIEPAIVPKIRIESSGRQSRRCGSEVRRFAPSGSLRLHYVLVRNNDFFERHRI